MLRIRPEPIDPRPRRRLRQAVLAALLAVPCAELTWIAWPGESDRTMAACIATAWVVYTVLIAGLLTYPINETS